MFKHGLNCIQRSKGSESRENELRWRLTIHTMKLVCGLPLGGLWAARPRTPSPPGNAGDIIAEIGRAQLPLGPKSPLHDGGHVSQYVLLDRASDACMTHLNHDASSHRPSTPVSWSAFRCHSCVVMLKTRHESAPPHLSLHPLDSEVIPTG